MERRIKIWALFLFLALIGSTFRSTFAMVPLYTDKTSYTKGVDTIVIVYLIGLLADTDYTIDVVGSGGYSSTLPVKTNNIGEASTTIPISSLTLGESYTLTVEGQSEIPPWTFTVSSFVIPEVPFGTLWATAFLLASLILFAVKRKAISLPRF